MISGNVTGWDKLRMQGSTFVILGCSQIRLICRGCKWWKSISANVGMYGGLGLSKENLNCWFVFVAIIVHTALLAGSV